MRFQCGLNTAWPQVEAMQKITAMLFFSADLQAMLKRASRNLLCPLEQDFTRIHNFD